jgi:hypothetical protein
MAEGIVFLDVDDEITSAASRIRSAPGTKVALVVPNGSRIATSRINFRLLSREALVSNRRLSVIAGDPASRALAASAGLPVFATVGEYEAALAGPKAVAEDVLAPAPVVTPEPASEPAPEPEKSPKPVRRASKAKAAGVGASAPVAAESMVDAVPDETTRMGVPVPPSRPIREARGEDRPDTRPPVAAGRSRVRAPVVAAIAAIALGVVVAGAAAYLFLPTATIAVTPRQESIQVALTIAADPTATDVDAARSIVPAIRLDVPVQASQTFTTAGRHVEFATASGSVTFENYNTGASNRIQAGSVVSTESGIRFRTLATVTLPPATLIPTTPDVTVQPSRRSVAVDAVRTGLGGNVPANAIHVVPQGENPQLLKVNNPDPTSGGKRTETPEVKKAEVDKAVASLQKALQASFADAIAAGAGAPPGTELFPTTASLGSPSFTPDPASLIGKAVATFDLEVSATGSVTAVDPSPIQSIAESRLKAQVGADHRLVNGSIHVDVANGTVGEDGQVTFQATATAARVLVVDPAQLRELVKGRTAADAAAALAPYGEATVSLWPSWVSTVTGIDSRLSITVDETAGSGAGPSGAPSSPASPSAKPSRAGGSTQPSPPAGSSAP